MTFKRIVITGFMGTGKTAVGKHLASRLKWLFFDTDALAETTEGFPVADIFSKKGEEYFRKLEKRCFEGLVSMSEIVIATGGGTLLNADNLKLAEHDSAVICLGVSEEELRKRLKGDKTRPLLKSGLVSAVELLKEREPQYKKMGIQIDTTGLSPAEVCDKIMSHLDLPNVP